MSVVMKLIVQAVCINDEQLLNPIGS